MHGLSLMKCWEKFDYVMKKLIVELEQDTNKKLVDFMREAADNKG